MKSLKKNVKKQLSVFLMLMLVLSANLTAQSAMPSTTERKDSGADVKELTIEEIMEIAEEEIERTAQEAVKAAMIEVGGELAYEKARADQLETAKKNLEEENKKLKAEVQKKQNQFFYGALIGGAGGVIVTSIVFNLAMGVCK
jgi:Na+-transporting NADH:ubiquinone oxidoreductase subunit NqrC